MESAAGDKEEGVVGESEGERRRGGEEAGWRGAVTFDRVRGWGHGATSEGWAAFGQVEAIRDWLVAPTPTGAVPAASRGAAEASGGVVASRARGKF